jgi:hypothetical protein
MFAKMLLAVAETPLYQNQAAKLLSFEERSRIIDLVAQSPKLGVLIPGSGGLRKLRIPLEGRGKRGGGRVIYWYHSQGFPAVLLWVLAKNAASDLTPDQAKRLQTLVASLLDDFGAKQ